MLTSLAWDVDDTDTRRGQLFKRVTHMTGLSQFKVSNKGYDIIHEDLVYMASLTKLRCLDLCNCTLSPNSVKGSSVLAPLTDLVSLGLHVSDIGMSLLSYLNLGNLHRLALTRVQGDTSVLQRATGLTQLEIDCGLIIPTESLRGLGDTLSRMSGLGSLSLHYLVLKKELPHEQTTTVFQLCPVLRALPCLTKLGFTGNFTVPDDISACASLSSLQSLTLCEARALTRSWLPALQAMSSLTELTLRNTGIKPVDVTPEVRAAFDAERLHRGWASLKLECS
jgi:hypothetical protein